ncbi:MAG: hypothetical protein HAW65_05400 [Alphaproteobacteria bacterium]|nr:hypothetical protein [Alphaproteobacteria bacterium]MBE8220724.1 hypothetical protein [Alphaproteobacteria bacterium]
MQLRQKNQEEIDAVFDMDTDEIIASASKSNIALLYEKMCAFFESKEDKYLAALADKRMAEGSDFISSDDLHKHLNEGK